MSVEEGKIDPSVPEASKEDTKLVTDTILEKTSEEAKGEAGELEKEKDQAKEEIKTEEKVEESEEKVKAPDETEAQIREVLKTFKIDPDKATATEKEMAKAYVHRQNLHLKQDDELGRTRKGDLEYQRLLKRIEDDPDGVKRDIDALHKKEEEKESLIDRAIENPKVLDEEIGKRVTAEFEKRDQKARTVEELRKVYPEFDQTAPQMKSLAGEIELGHFSKEEVLHLMVLGHHAVDMLKDAKNLARKEDAEALAKRAQAGVETQTTIVEGKPEKAPSDKVWDTMSKASR